MKMQRFALVITLVNLVILMFVLAAMRPAIAQGTAPVLRGRSLEIVDDRGRVRASISVLPAGVSAHGDRSPETVLLRLITERGRPSVKIGASEEAAGLSFAGPTNTIKDGGRVDSNGLSGLLVTGSGNTLKNLQAGSDATKGNGTSNTFQANVVNLAGIQVTGANNILDNNRQNANKGWGVYVSGASTTVKNNQSNTGSSASTKENTNAEYRFTVSIVGAVSNKKDNGNFTSTAAGTYE